MQVHLLWVLCMAVSCCSSVVSCGGLAFRNTQVHNCVIPSHLSRDDPLFSLLHLNDNDHSTDDPTPVPCSTSTNASTDVFVGIALEVQACDEAFASLVHEVVQIPNPQVDPKTGGAGEGVILDWVCRWFARRDIRYSS